MRTNIEIEDDDVRIIMDRFGVHTKTEAVALAYRTGLVATPTEGSQEPS